MLHPTAWLLEAFADQCQHASRHMESTFAPAAQAEEKPMHHAITVSPLAARQELWQHLDVPRLVPALVSGVITGLRAITLSLPVGSWQLATDKATRPRNCCFWSPAN